MTHFQLATAREPAVTQEVRVVQEGYDVNIYVNDILVAYFDGEHNMFKVWEDDLVGLGIEMKVI